MHEARNRQSVDRLGTLNGVTARDDRAGLVGLVVAAAQDFLHRMIVHALRQTHDVERELGLTTHGVHVAERVGSRDLSVQERIVHDGREEVGRLHERGVLIEHIHACVIALVIADDQTRVGMRAIAFKQVYERSGTDFAPQPAQPASLVSFTSVSIEKSLRFRDLLFLLYQNPYRLATFIRLA